MKTKKPEELAQRSRIRALLAGSSGSGKTTGALTLPGKLLLIDLDGRAEAAIPFGDRVEIVEIVESSARSPRAWMELTALLRELKAFSKGSFPYEGVILDGLTAANRLAMTFALTLDKTRGLGGTAARHHYGPAMNEIFLLLNDLLGLPCNIVVVCHLELHEDEESGGSMLFPKVVGKFRSELPGMFNETYITKRAIETLPGHPESLRYLWITKGSGKFDFAKSTFNSLGEIWNDPLDVTLTKELIEKKGFVEILRRVQEHRKEVSVAV